MTAHERRADELHQSGYNCAQAVFAAFADEMGMDERAALRLASAFGGGIGRLREVCGAASGMAMVLGALEGCDDPKEAAKLAYYDRVRALMDAFRAEFGSFICRDLLAQPADDPDWQKPCARCVRFAARLLEERVHP